MKRKWTALFIAMVFVLVSGTLSGCSKEEITPESEQLNREMGYETSDFDDPAYQWEEDGAELISVPHKKEDFIGNWKATSNQAEYLWGNVDLKIREGGKWSGNITEEDLHGKWFSDGTGIILKDSEKIINWRLYFTPDNILVFEEIEEPGDATVLKPVGGQQK